MIDLKWIVDQNADLLLQGRVCPRKFCEAILNGVAMAEQEVVFDYTYARNRIEEVCKGEPKLAEVMCKMLNHIIEDEGDHRASVAKAAALCGGYKEAKTSDLDDAGKIDDAKTV